MRLCNLLTPFGRADKKAAIKPTVTNKISQEELSRLFAKELKDNIRTKLPQDAG